MADLQPLNLTNLTAEQAVKALASGATLRLADGNDLPLADEDARKALRFFLKDRIGKGLWDNPPNRGSTDIAAALFKWLDAPHQNEVVSAKADEGAGPLWRVTRLSISNFGGLHPFWNGDGDAPPVLDIDFERDVTLIEGGNGSGKTSLAKAMTFCLTGQVCRSSGPPMSWDRLRNDYLLPMEGIVAVEGDEEAEVPERPGVSLPSIVPMPTAEQWKRATEKGITVKVAVAVTLTDGTRTTTIQRSLSGNHKGKFSATLLADDAPIPSGSPAQHLGISELALELATVHLARLPFIRIGEADDLGKALAELTGLTPLGTVATQTAPLLARYLRGSFLTGANGVRKLRDAKEKAFTDKAGSLAEIFAETPAAKRPPAPQAPIALDGGEYCEEGLAALDKDLSEREAVLKARITAATGLDLEAVPLSLLEAHVTELSALLQPERLSAGPQGQLLADVEELSPDDLKATKGAIDAVLIRCRDYAARLAEGDRAIRRRLYGLVASWLPDEAKASLLADCPVCDRPLTGEVIDSVLDVSVAEAIKAACEDHADLRLGLDDFNQQIATELLESLPPVIGTTLTAFGKAGGSAALCRQGWIDAVADAAMTETRDRAALKPLVEAAVADWRKAAGDLPLVPESSPPDLPPALAGGRIAKGLGLLAGLLSLSQWVRSTMGKRSEVLLQVWSPPLVAHPGSDVHRRLKDLTDTLTANRPVSESRRLLTDLRSIKSAWDELVRTMEKAERAAKALDLLLPLGKAVDAQVHGLMGTLNDSIQDFTDRFYRSPGFGGPEIVGIGSGGDSLHLNVRLGDVEGKGTDITNSSRERTTLFAFVLALTRHVRRGGGLRLLVLDDPQLLFDEFNQTRLARGLVGLHKDEFQPFIVTFDKPFAAIVSRGGNLVAEDPSPLVDRRLLVARSNDMPVAKIEPHCDRLMTLQAAWKAAPNDPGAIQGFCGEARVFTERSLVRMFRYSLDPISGLKTLQPLAERLRALTGVANSVFATAPFKALLELLPGGGVDDDLRDGLNWAHHFSADDLVRRHADVVAEFIDKAMVKIDLCFELLWNADEGLVREVLAKAAAPEKLPSHPPQAGPKLHLVGTLAAEEGRGVDEDLIKGDLAAGPHRCFVVGAAAQWLPPLVRPGSILLTEVEPSPPDGKDLVVVWNLRSGEAIPAWAKPKPEEGRLLLQGVAGRYVRSMPLEECITYRVRGLAYATLPVPRRPCEEVPGDDHLRQWHEAVRIAVGDSAEPLLREGDLVILGDQLDEQALRLAVGAVAIVLDDGTRLVKRVGSSRVPGCVSLLPLGDQGGGDIAAISADPPAGIPRIANARGVIGWLKG